MVDFSLYLDILLIFCKQLSYKQTENPYILNETSPFFAKKEERPNLSSFHAYC